MNGRNVCRSIFAAAAFALAAYAQADQTVQKIGFINTERIYLESKQAQGIQKTLEKEFGSRQSELEKLQKEGETLERRLSSGSMKAAERETAEKQWTVLAQRYRKQQSSLAEDYNLRRNEEFASLQQNANRVIVDIAKKEGYDVILQDVVYVNSRYDITDAVIKAMNAR